MTSTEVVTRGATRLLLELGYAPITEVPLTNGRRADIVSLDPKGHCMIVEVKSGLADFRSDHKWQEYLDYGEEFYFAVDQDFPLEVLNEETSLPDITGIMIADAYGAEILRSAANRRMNAARKKTLTLKMARLGGMRLAEQVTGAPGLTRPGSLAPSSTPLIRGPL
ncbi:MmcB family DNA repair protein [Kordiimonas sp.]|uniref:MmcB family DNA repair protein n=1 Tax=Kordiimonas sp. TaxID=1970157 RepID=UPI003B52411D